MRFELSAPEGRKFDVATTGILIVALGMTLNGTSTAAAQAVDPPDSSEYLN